MTGELHIMSFFSRARYSGFFWLIGMKGLLGAGSIHRFNV